MAPATKQGCAAPRPNKGDEIPSASLFRAVKRVHQFHDGGDAGVEVPAALQVVGHTLDGLVKLALDLARAAGERDVAVRRFLQTAAEFLTNEAVDPAQESVDAFDAGILPVQVAVRRRGEQAVQARGIGAVARDHFVGLTPRCPDSSTSSRRL